MNLLQAFALVILPILIAIGGRIVADNALAQADAALPERAKPSSRGRLINRLVARGRHKSRMG